MVRPEDVLSGESTAGGVFRGFRTGFEMDMSSEASWEVSREPLTCLAVCAPASCCSSRGCDLTLCRRFKVKLDVLEPFAAFTQHFSSRCFATNVTYRDAVFLSLQVCVRACVHARTNVVFLTFKQILCVQ